ncbi:hypothetical protein OSTOST_15359 [Ostertagia ostertagi]
MARPLLSEQPPSALLQGVLDTCDLRRLHRRHILGYYSHSFEYCVAFHLSDQARGCATAYNADDANLAWLLKLVSVETMAITALPIDVWLKERLKKWVQLSGHEEID